MPTKIAFKAVPAPRRLSIDQSSLIVVLLLSALFAAAILAALAPHGLVDASLAAVQGGL